MMTIISYSNALRAVRIKYIEKAETKIYRD
jgi:hypothetical protein